MFKVSRTLTTSEWYLPNYKANILLLIGESIQSQDHSSSVSELKK